MTDELKRKPTHKVTISPNHACGNGEVKPCPMCPEKERKKADKTAWDNWTDIIITVKENGESKNALKLCKMLGLKVK